MIVCRTGCDSVAASIDDNTLRSCPASIPLGAGFRLKRWPVLTPAGSTAAIYGAINGAFNADPDPNNGPRRKRGQLPGAALVVGA